MPKRQAKPPKQPEEMPPRGKITLRSAGRTVRKPLKWILAYWAVGLLMTVVAVALAPMMMTHSYLPCVVGFVFLAVIAVGLEVWLRKRRALRAPGVCHSCGYNLRGLGRRGKCPECAAAYRLDEEQDRG